jgi:DNA (cytosine-5)-methyltransferase 1
VDLPRNQLLFGFADAVCVPAIKWIDEHVLTPLYESALPMRKVARTRQPKP